jgi:hypothetical protein
MEVREHKRRVTRRRLADAAYRLFRECGYDDTTVETIAAAAGGRRAPSTATSNRRTGCWPTPAEVVQRVLPRLPPAPPIDRVVAESAAVMREAAETGDLGRVMRLLRDSPQLMDQAALWRRRWAARLAAGLAEADGAVQPELVHQVTAVVRDRATDRPRGR